ncbi:hypothetical protein SprV_0501930100 [Sparganum proliferum]
MGLGTTMLTVGRFQHARANRPRRIPSDAMHQQPGNINLSYFHSQDLFETPRRRPSPSPTITMSLSLHQQSPTSSAPSQSLRRPQRPAPPTPRHLVLPQPLATPHNHSFSH